MKKKTEIRLGERILKACVEKGGDLIITLDLDATQIKDFPQGNETYLKSKHDELPENWNDDVCLAANQNIVYVNKEPFWITGAQKKVLLILYNQPNFMLDYMVFANEYRKGEEVISKPKRGTCVSNSAMRHTNNYFIKNHIPLIIKRYNSVIQLEKICED